MKTQIFILMLFVTAGVCNADLTWEYWSPLTVLEEITDIGGGNYQYEYSFTNIDTSVIWDFVVYTEFTASPQTGFDNLQYWVSPQFVPVDSYYEEYDPRILDQDIAGGVGTSYEHWQYGEEYGIQINDTVAGFAFTSTIYDPLSKYYRYTTIETSGPTPYLKGVVSAVGMTVPEPFTFSIMCLGGLIVLKRKQSI